MEVLVLVIGLIVIAGLLSFITVFVLFHSLHLINAMNKRTVFLLEKMYHVLGLTASQNIEDISAEMARVEKEVGNMMNRNPERPYDPHEEASKIEEIDL